MLPDWVRLWDVGSFWVSLQLGSGDFEDVLL